jgi:TonB-linked SusC/RagA family outer membrane protein
MKIISVNKGLSVHFYSLIFASLFVSALARAHTSPTCDVIFQQMITGVVSDALGPLPGVAVQVKGTSVVVVTNEQGKYSIQASSTDILIFSFVGFKTIEVPISGRSLINTLLAEDSTQLQELEINAGYYTVKDKERTGSIARITAEDIQTQPVTNTLAAMQGRMAGVEITQNTGVAGGGFDISIRGRNSIRPDGNSPLFIIDGVPYSSESIGFSGTMRIMNTFTSPLNNLNPADVASIEVLKDADATAIYGSRGANGVVLITTKKGKAGKTTFSASIASGMGQVPHFMDLLDTQQYLAVRAEGLANDGLTEPPYGSYDIDGTWDSSKYTDWQKKLIGGNASITNISTGLQGGSEFTQFSITGNFGNETAVFPGDYGYKKANLRNSLSHLSFDRRFRLEFSAGYTVQDNDQPLTDPTFEAFSTPPNAPDMYDAQGNVNWADGTFRNNPARHFLGGSKSRTHDLVANTVLSYKVTDALTLRTSVGYTDLKHHEASLTPHTVYPSVWGLGPESSMLYYNDVTRRSWIIEPQAQWLKIWGKLETDVLAGATFQQQDNSQLAISATGFSNNSLIENPAAATFLSVLGVDESVYKYQALFGRVNLKWDGRYILNLTGRRDGSSRFGSDNRFALFGAAGAAWLFSNEAWMESQKIISVGKLRASYGVTGNDQIGNYQYLDSYALSGYTYQGIPGLQPNRLHNPSFGWETNRKLEVAMEMGFLNDRILFSAGWYRNRSSNQLVGVPMPGTTGFSTLQANLDAVVENRGIELTLQTVNIRSANFTWTTDLNFTAIRNELISFPGLASSPYANQYVIGKPLNIVKLYHYTGLDNQTGLYTFEDSNGDGTISAPTDKQALLDLNPKFYGGLQNQLHYGNWQLDFLLQFVSQDNIDSRKSVGVPGQMGNVSTVALERWSQPGDVGPAQRYTAGYNSDAVSALYNYSASDAMVVDASYVRLKNLQLSYSLPTQWTGKASCRLFLQGQNLITFTSFKGPDPEFRSIGSLPPLRIITTGIQLSF